MDFSPPPRRPLRTKKGGGLKKRNPNIPINNAGDTTVKPPQPVPPLSGFEVEPPKIFTANDNNVDDDVSTYLEKLAMEANCTASLSSLPTPVINFMSSLATSRRIAEADVADLKQQVHQLRLTIDIQANDNKSLNSAVFSSEQEAAGARVKLESVNKQHKKQAAKLVAERDEYKALSVRLAGRDEQYKASMRKMEVDYESLRKQLQKRVQQERKGSGSFKAFEAKGKLPSRERGTDDKAFLSKLNSSLEMRQSELLFENDSLRAELKSLGGEVNEVVGKVSEGAFVVWCVVC